MGAQNASFGKGLLNASVGGSAHAQAERPFRTREILRLHRSKPVYYLSWTCKSGSGDLLTVQTLVGHDSVGHTALFYFAGSFFAPQAKKEPATSAVPPDHPVPPVRAPDHPAAG